MINQIIDHFGEENQVNKAIEEMLELCVALTHYKDGKVCELDVVDEIADVQIMLAQLEVIFGIEDVHSVIRHKVNRTIERIEDGYYEL